MHISHDFIATKLALVMSF